MNNQVMKWGHFEGKARHMGVFIIFLFCKTVSVLPKGTQTANPICHLPIAHKHSGHKIVRHKKYGASLVAQLVKNPPAVQETWIGSLG